MDCPRQHKSLVEATTGTMVPLYCVIVILGDWSLFHKRKLFNHKIYFLLQIKKTVAENTVPQKREININIIQYNYFSYTKKYLKNKKLIFTSAQLSVLIYYNKAPTLENQ